MKKIMAFLMAFSLVMLFALNPPKAFGLEADAPGKDLPDVPRYPGTIRDVYYDYGYLYGAPGLPFRQDVYYHYFGTASGSTIMDFYKSKMPENGWALIAENLTMPGLENVAWLWEAEFQKIDAHVFLNVVEIPLLGGIEIYIRRTAAAVVEIENILAEENFTVEFENQIVSDVEITAKTAISSGTVSVKVVIPEEVPAPLENALYYINLTTDVAENINNATIRFKVPKGWISENNIDPATVRLWRYTENWVELPTRAIGEEENFYKYSAETTGFSIFTVTGRRAVPSELPSEFPLVWMAIGSVLVIVAVISAVWIGTRYARGDATSVLLEHGLHDMTVRDVEIVGKIMNLKKFTIPELMRRAHASRMTTWRTVQKLIELGLVQPTEQTDFTASGLGGRGRPSRVYKYIGAHLK